MFHGSIVALITPMQPDGVLDLESLRSLIEWHIEEGTNAIVVNGSTGEASTLTHVERGLIIQQALEQIKGRVPLIAGTGTNSTSSTIEYTRQAMELGADACLLVTPYYNKPTQEGLFQHFKAVSEAVPVPQILYNVPSRTACDLKPETVVRLENFSNIIGLKEATGDLDRLHELLSLTDGKIDLYSGDDPTGMEFILRGGRGVISVTANVAPRLMSQMCEMALAEDASAASRINNQLAKLHKDLCIETNPIPVKWALTIMGKVPSGIRLPLTSLSGPFHQTVRTALEQAGVF